MGDDLINGLQGRHGFVLSLIEFREAFVQNRQDLHPLDGIDSQVMLQVHIPFHHIPGESGILRNDIQHRIFQLLHIGQGFGCCGGLCRGGFGFGP